MTDHGEGDGTVAEVIGNVDQVLDTPLIYLNDLWVFPAKAKLSLPHTSCFAGRNNPAHCGDLHTDYNPSLPSSLLLAVLTRTVPVERLLLVHL